MRVNFCFSHTVTFRTHLTDFLQVDVDFVLNSFGRMLIWPFSAPIPKNRSFSETEKGDEDIFGTCFKDYNFEFSFSMVKSVNFLNSS